MSTLKIFTLATSSVALAGLAFFTGCDKKEGDSLTYCSPVSDAGADQSVALGLDVVLDGSGSGVGEGCEEHELTFEWDYESVPADSAIDISSLSDNNSPVAETPEFLPDVPGSYVLSLIVCDEIECSAPDIVVVSVAAGDAAPIADAGPDQVGEEDVRVTLDGSGSYDPDGDELTYSWSLTDVPECSGLTSTDIHNSTSVEPSVIPDCEGQYQVGLVVSDGDQWSAPDYAIIEVGSGNQLPVADAGDSSVIAPCEGGEIMLDGTRSYDPEGSELNYIWTLVAQPSSSASSDANFDDASLSRPTFSWDIPGDYTFQLQVFDGDGWSPPDVVTMTMVDPSENTAPTANAGEDQSVEVEAECTSDAYVFTCEDCEGAEFVVDGSASFDEDGDELNFYWSESSGEADITSPNTAVTSVMTPALPAEHDTPNVAVYDLALNVSDCELENEDVVRLTVTCTGSD